MATQLSRTFGSQGNQTKFTISTWVKRNKLGSSQSIFGSGGSGNYATNMQFHSSDKIYFWNYFGGAYAGQKYSSAVYRDTSAWYHIVFRVDTTSATASERMRIYVNGEEISYATSNNPNQNQTMEVGHTGTHYIGGYGTGANAEMCMSHFHYCDGQSYAPTEFGEYDANGVWKIKLELSVSYGVSGHFLFNNDASVTDQSGLGNNWSVNSGTLTQTEDNPSNVFATLNPLYTATDTNFNYSNGNTVGSNSGLGRNNYLSTLGVSSGKYYIEAKANVSGSNYATVGVSAVDSTLPDDKDNYIGKLSDGVGYFQSGIIRVNAVTVETVSSYTTNDIIGVAGDFDNNKVYFYKNGVLQTTTGITIPSDTTYYFGGRVYDNNTSWTFNFGNGYFGTTAVASAGTNASGNGIFEYDVPTGYTALSTKGLNT